MDILAVILPCNMSDTTCKILSSQRGSSQGKGGRVEFPLRPASQEDYENGFYID
jgi:hypothetical protein